MRIDCRANEKGLTLKFKNKKFSLVYPKKIWQKFPKDVKGVLTDNLAHLLTIDIPLVAGVERLKLNTSSPLFKDFFHTLVLNSIPGAVEDYDIGTNNIIKQFNVSLSQFNGNNIF